MLYKDVKIKYKMNRTQYINFLVDTGVDIEFLKLTPTSELAKLYNILQENINNKGK